jgi:hypothetical protein
LKENRGTVLAFKINQLKRLNGLNFKYGTVRAFDFFREKRSILGRKNGTPRA